MRSPKDRLIDMLDAIDNIERYAGRRRAVMDTNNSNA